MAHTNKIPFYKMHGLGNDFMVIDNIEQSINLNQLAISQLADRHLGIGFDQLLVIETSSLADFACRIFNADGSEAEQCGNGLRCVARYIFDNQLSRATVFTIATKAGVFNAEIQADNLVKISMGVPSVEPPKTLKINGHHEAIQLTVLSMGNPHAIMQVPAIKDFPVQTIGQQVAMHPAFPNSTNVGFMEIIDRQQIRLRTFERGSGETLACGSNACAAVVAGIINNTLDQTVKVGLTFGDLLIEWKGVTDPVTMTGSATHVYAGWLEI